MAFDRRAHFCTQSHFDFERERLIVHQIQAAHDQIGDKLFTYEVVSQIYYHLFKPSTSTSIHNEVLERYMRSLSGGNEHRLKNELQILDFTGQVSSFFVRGQNLEAFEADELSSTVEEWAVATKSIYSAPWGDKETAALALQSRFDFFRKEKGFGVWDQQNLKLLRNSLAGKYTASFSSEATGLVQAHATDGKRELGLVPEERPGSKRATPTNGVYNAILRQKNPRGAFVETIKVDVIHGVDEVPRAMEMDLS